jgi:hypothetical protein
LASRSARRHALPTLARLKRSSALGREDQRAGLMLGVLAVGPKLDDPCGVGVARAVSA